MARNAVFPAIAVVVAIVLAYLFVGSRQEALKQGPPTPPALSAPKDTAPGLAARPDAVSEEKKGSPSTDLYTELQALKVRAGRGDANAKWLISRLAAYCGDYVRNPAAYVANTTSIASGVPEPRGALFLMARERVSTQCRRLSNADLPNAAQLGALVSEAAKGGSLAAQVGEIGARPATAAEAKATVDLVDAVRDSKDPEAYLALGDAVVSSEAAKNAAFGGAATVGEAQLALQLIACRRGLDCSATGQLLTSYCANGGVCGPYSDFFALVHQGLLTQAGGQRVDDLVHDFTKER